MSASCHVNWLASTQNTSRSGSAGDSAGGSFYVFEIFYLAWGRAGVVSTGSWQLPIWTAEFAMPPSYFCHFSSGSRIQLPSTMNLYATSPGVTVIVAVHAPVPSAIIGEPGSIQLL